MSDNLSLDASNTIIDHKDPLGLSPEDNSDIFMMISNSPLRMVPLLNENQTLLTETSYIFLPSSTNGTTKFTCPILQCSATFHSKSQLEVHKKTHSRLSEVIYNCEICGKNFSGSYALKAHKRTHTGEKPYMCPEDTCKKKFKTSGDLQKHIRTHTGERPFKCQECGKAFTTSNIRKVHMRIHTGEKPYACTYKGCTKRFSSATNFRNHTRIHTGEKPFVCRFDNCNKRFTEYSSLYKHYLVHVKTRQHTCDICGRSYRQASTLAVHRNSVHKVSSHTSDFTKLATSDERLTNVAIQDPLLLPSPAEEDKACLVNNPTLGSADQSILRDGASTPCKWLPQTDKVITSGSEAILVLSFPACEKIENENGDYITETELPLTQDHVYSIESTTS